MRLVTLWILLFPVLASCESIFTPLAGNYFPISSYCTGEDGSEDVAEEFTRFSLTELDNGWIQLDWDNRNDSPFSQKWHPGTVETRIGDSLTVTFSQGGGYDAIIQVDDRPVGEDQWGTVMTTIYRFRNGADGLTLDSWGGQTGPNVTTFTTCHSVLGRG